MLVFTPKVCASYCVWDESASNSVTLGLSLHSLSSLIVYFRKKSKQFCEAYRKSLIFYGYTVPICPILHTFISENLIHNCLVGSSFVKRNLICTRRNIFLNSLFHTSNSSCIAHIENIHLCNL